MTVPFWILISKCVVYNYWRSIGTFKFTGSAVWISTSQVQLTKTIRTGFICSASFSLLSWRTSFNILSIPLSDKAFCDERQLEHNLEN